MTRSKLMKEWAVLAESLQVLMGVVRERLAAWEGFDASSRGQLFLEQRQRITALQKNAREWLRMFTVELDEVTAPAFYFTASLAIAGKTCNARQSALRELHAPDELLAAIMDLQDECRVAEAVREELGDDIIPRFLATLHQELAFAERRRRELRRERQSINQRLERELEEAEGAVREHQRCMQRWAASSPEHLAICARERPDLAASIRVATFVNQASDAHHAPTRAADSRREKVVANPPVVSRRRVKKRKADRSHQAQASDETPQRWSFAFRTSSDDAMLPDAHAPAVAELRRLLKKAGCRVQAERIWKKLQWVTTIGQHERSRLPIHPQYDGWHYVTCYSSWIVLNIKEQERYMRFFVHAHH